VKGGTTGAEIKVYSGLNDIGNQITGNQGGESTDGRTRKGCALSWETE